MPTPHFHLTGAEALKFVSLLVIVKFLAKGVTAHHRDSAWAQGLGWVLD